MRKHLLSSKKAERLSIIKFVLISLFIVFQSTISFGQFSGYYDPANWTLSNVNSNGSVNTAGAPASIAITGSNTGTGGVGVITYSIAVQNSGNVSFNWNVSHPDAGWDNFEYVLNGVATFITDQNTSGSTTVPVTAGDIFAFQITSEDNGAGAPTVTITNFSNPQNINMQTGSFTTCSANFYDNGGPGANYANGSNQTLTFCPSNPGDAVSVQFLTFQVETNWDALYVYNGPTTASPQISSGNPAGNVPGGLPGGYWGSTPPGPFTSTDPSGCLTFVFISDGSVSQAGWTATVSCITPCVAPATAGTATASVTSVCNGVNFNLNLSGNSVGVGQTYQWQSSPDNATWTNIGASSASAAFTTSQTSASYYQALVTCNGITSTSTSVFVGAQDCINMQNGTFTTCEASFFDSGGSGGLYGPNEDFTITFFPGTPGEVIKATFLTFQVETNWDALYVYDGPSIASPQISSGNPANNVPGGVPGGFWGAAPPGPFTSTDPSGALTFRFRSDGSVQQAGWSASIECVIPPPPPPPTILMHSGSESTCNALFYDSGGQFGNYLNGENLTLTFCPDVAGQAVSVNFTSFNVEATWDALYVYDGPNTSSPQISSGNPAGNVPGGIPGGFWGSTNPGPFTSTHPCGCLTFVFRSDGSVQFPGWAANVTCAPAIPGCDPNLALTDIILSNPIQAAGNTVTISIDNAGTSPQSNFNVSYQIDGGAVITELIAGPVTPCVPFSYTFTTPFNATAGGGAHSIVASIDLPGDCNPANNSLTESFTTPCAFCPAGAYIENEACGADMNGGCNMAVPTFESINIGQVVCGQGWASGGTRDTDWYQFTLATSTAVEIQLLSADFPALIGFLDGNFGCPVFAFIASATTGAACGSTSVAAVLGPGTYWAFVGPSVFDGFPCGTGNGYQFKVDFPPPPVNPINMQNGSFTTCGATFYDSGGPFANYGNSENLTMTLCPDVSGQAINVDFTAFNVESNWDALYVYDGPNTGSPLIASPNPSTISGFPAGGWYGTSNPGPFTSTHSCGCLTFVFRSDPSVALSGWSANVNCVPAAPACDPNLALSDIILSNPIQSSGNTVTVVIDNAGTSPQSNVSVSYQIDAGPVITEIAPGPIVPCVSYTYTFAATFNAAAGGTTHTVYASVDAPGDCNTANNSLSETFTTPCAFCPAGAYIENEACGADINGGCNMPVPFHEPINIGQVVCGQGWASGNTRDTDWYQFTLAANSGVELNLLSADFPALIGFINASAGCGFPSFFVSTTTAANCGSTALQANLTAGTWWAFVAPSVFNGYPCGSGNAYQFELTIPPPPVNDDICDALPLIFGANGPYNNGLATAQFGEPAPPGGNCNSQMAWCENNVTNSLWFSFIAPPSGSVSLESQGFDTQLAVYSASDCELPVSTVLLSGSISGVNSQSIPITDPCPTNSYSLFIQGNSWGDAITWNITDASNTVVASGGPYGLGYSQTVNFTSTNPPLTFNINSGLSDNSANYTLSCIPPVNPPIASGSISGVQSSSVPGISCASNTYTVFVQGNSWGDAVTWNLTDASNNVVASGGPYFTFPGYSETVTVSASNSPLTFNINSGFSDNSANYSITCADAPQFTLLAANDDGAGLGSLISGLNCLTPGETYWVQLDGWSGSTGNATITLTELYADFELTGVADCEGNVTLTPVGGTGAGYEFSNDGVNYFTPGGGVPNDYTLFISNTSWGDAVTWNITDATNTVIASGGPYFGSSGGYTDMVTVTSANPPLTFFVQSTLGDNGATYSIECNSNVLVSGSIAGVSSATETGINCSAGGITYTFVQPLSTTQTYYLKDSRGCVIETTVVTTPDPLPAPVIVSDQTMPLCAGESTTLSSQYLAADGYQFNWGGLLFTESITVGIATDYTLVVTDSFGCETAEAFFTVEIASIFGDVGTVTDVLCNGGSDGTVEIDVLGSIIDPTGTLYFGPFEYAVNGGPLQSDSIFTGLAAGTYTFEVHDPTTGCVLLVNGTVGEPDPLTLGITVDQNATCSGGFGTATGQGSGGVGPYTYNWLTPIPKQVQTNDEIPAGTWTVVVEDANGCTATATVTIEEPDPIVVDLGPDRVIPYGTANGFNAIGCTDIIPVITGGSGNYVDFDWSNGDTTATITGVCNPVTGTDGVYTYTVTVTDDNGCVGTGTVTLFWSNIDCSNNTNGTKIKICMVPPGNPSQCQTVCIAVAAAPALLANTPSYIGTCNPGCAPARIMAPEPITENISVNLLPNPTTGRILVDFASESQSASSIVITDLQGRVVMNVALDGSASFTKELDMSILENGLYILNIMNTEGLISTSRVVKAN